MWREGRKYKIVLLRMAKFTRETLSGSAKTYLRNLNRMMNSFNVTIRQSGY